MVVEYMRSLQKNHMIIKEIKEEIVEREEEFCVRMLEKNTIDNIVYCEERIINGEKHLYYDITSKQSFDNIYIKATMSYSQVREFLLNIIDTIEMASEYLLNVNDFILKAEYIYLDLKSRDANLCYLSGYHMDIKEQMGDLMEHMMNRVDYKDRQAVALVYDLYGICKEDSYTFAHLKQTILSSNKKDVTQERKQEVSEKASNKVSNKVKIPVMKEKTIGEEEVLYYPIKNHIIAAVGIIGGIFILVIGSYSGLIYNSLGKGIDYVRLFLLLIILLSLEGYLMKHLWDKKNKVSKIITKEEYIEAIEQPASPQAAPYKPMPSKEKSEEDEYNPTCLLSDIEEDIERESSYYLKAVKKDVYETIHIKEFPYFIGKVKKQMDYCLDYQGVSRYHAKITREDDKCYITDLNSTNGTCLNNDLIQPYEPIEIKEGDQVTLANIKYKLTLS